MRKIFSSRQVANLVGADPSSVNRWIDSGKINAHRTPGGHRRVLYDDLIDFLEQCGMPLPAELRSKPIVFLIGEFTPATKKAVKSTNGHSTFEKDLTTALMRVGKINPNIVVLSSIGTPAVTASVVQALKKHQDSMKVITLPTGAKPSEITNAILN